MTKKEMITKDYGTSICGGLLDINEVDDDCILDGDTPFDKDMNDKYFHESFQFQDEIRDEQGIMIMPYKFDDRILRQFHFTCFDNGTYRHLFIFKTYYNKYLYFNKHSKELRERGIKSPNKIYAVCDEDDLIIIYKKFGLNTIFAKFDDSSYQMTTDTGQIVFNLGIKKMDDVYVLYNLINKITSPSVR